jgi:hypothetical protein
MQVRDDVAWSASDFVLAAVLLTTLGVALELAVKRAGNRLLAAGIAAFGIAAAVGGQQDDAPGLVLIGLLLLASACALAARTSRRAPQQEGEIERGGT